MEAREERVSESESDTLPNAKLTVLLLQPPSPHPLSFSATP